MTELAGDDDAALVARCRRGEEAAWKSLVQRYQRLVYAIVRRMGHDEHTAADVFQAVFARLIAHLPRIADPRRLQAWIVTTTKREGLLALRRAKRTVSMTPVDASGDEAAGWDVADDALLPEDVLANLQQLDLVRHALGRLGEPCRELLQLLFRDDEDKLPYEEIARMLGMQIGSIGPTRSRCLGKLRRLVEPASRNP